MEANWFKQRHYSSIKTLQQSLEEEVFGVFYVIDTMDITHGLNWKNIINDHTNESEVCQCLIIMCTLILPSINRVRIVSK